mmetsp:Transcript_23545/g.33626  ORF Transcript_23545/g.33626 Transcript_23545/m.33626 type:complete len:105 (-) Transcript_23545:845-1159(-)
MRGAAQRACSEDGLSLNLLWSSILASIEVWLKFDRVSWPLYLIYDKNGVHIELLFELDSTLQRHIWGTRSLWNFEVNNKVRCEIGSSTSQGPRLKIRQIPSTNA